MQLELSKEYIERLQTAIEEQDVDFVVQSMQEQHPADITAVLHELDTAESKFVVDQLDNEITAEIISNLDVDTRKRFLKVFESEEVALLLPFMNSDDATDLLEEQPVKFREEVIALIDDVETANNIIELLHYDDDCAGGLMAKELIKANINWSVVQTIEEIRSQAENVDKIFSVYVVDDNDRLLGIVSVKKILLARANTLIADIFESDIISIESYREDWEVVDLIRKYDLEAIPVVNMAGRLLGVITIDDVVDVITEQAVEEQQIMSGITQNVEEDDNVWRSTRARLPWLLIGMIGGLTGAQFMGFFENDLQLVPAMAFFIPLITATGGNVGIQSSTIMIQSLASSTGLESSFLLRIIKVLLIALLNASIMCSIVFGFVLISGQETKLASVVSLALFSVVILASLMGTITPIILDKLGINPALASGPFITTANDLIGLGVYFGMAHLLFGM